MNNKYSIADKYFIIWSFFIPITSWAIDPNIKGSLVSYLFAFLSPLVILCFYRNIIKNYIWDILKIILVLTFLALMSQISNLIYNIELTNVILINPGDYANKIFRPSLITQSIYLIPVILTFLYVKYLYKPTWDKWIVYSGFVFVIYGFFKWGYFLVMGQDGDFLTNRTFGDSDTVLFPYQTVVLAGLELQRFQSLTGEPSMLAFTLLPYFIFAVHRKVNFTMTVIMGLALLLSTSSTAYIGIAVYIIYLFICSKKNKNFFLSLLGIIIVSCILYGVFTEYIDDVIDKMIVNKADSGSGEARQADLLNHIDYIMGMDIMHNLFGIGFGYIRSGDLLSTLLVNTGIIGVMIFTYFYLKDFRIKVGNFIELGNNSILLSLFIVSMVAVSEFSYLSFWLFLAIIRSREKLSI